MTPWHLAPGGWQAHERGAVAALDDGATLAVRFYGEALARITLRPAGGYKEPRTWAIAPVPAGEHRADTPWQGRERDDDGGFGPAPALQRSADGQAVGTAALQVRLGGAPGAAPVLQWSHGPQGLPLCSDRATGAWLREARTGAARHYLQRARGERYYGLGDKTGALDLHGRRLRTLAMDSLGYDPEHGDPLYKHWPFVLCRTEAGAWYGLYYDTLCACTFDLGCEHDNYHGLYRHVEIDDGDLDVYLMAGATPGEVIAQFLRLIGGTAPAPRWSLGFAQTAMGLADAPDAQARLDAFIDRIAEHRVPISAFHYGSGYSSRGVRRYVFTWNRSKFPDPKALNAKFARHGLKLVANLKPALLDDHPDWAEVAALGGFIHDARSGRPVLEPFWDGLGAHLDFSAPATIAWWQQRLQAQVLDWGIDVGWNDNNEYAVLDEHAASAGFGTPIPMHRSRPLHALLMTRATYEVQQRRAAAGEAAFTVTRAGPPGIQRYAQTWTGDNTTSWRTLRWNIRTGLQMSLSGLFNTGHDVGGFYGPVPDAELFLRWVQACCLNPRMVMNSWKPGNVTNLPWMHPEVTADVVRALELRYRLMPYLAALFERAVTRHEPILRPTFYEFPSDEACYADSDDFLLGPDLLVAPVVEPGKRCRRVYLPALPGAAAWHAFDTGEALASGRWHEVDAPLARLPLFVRGGARIPLAEVPEGGGPLHDLPTSHERSFGA